MSLVDLELGNTPELELVPEGEQRLRVTDSEVKESNAGNQMLHLVMDSPQHELAEEVHDYFVFPTMDDGEKTVIRKKRNLEEVCEAFGVPFGPDGFDTDDFIGSDAEALIQHDEDPEYGTSARVQRYITGA